MNVNLLENGVSIRWLNTAGFEILLPNGKNILVDPWLTGTPELQPAPEYQISIDKIDRADYLLLSHIHWDHADDVHMILEKFPKTKVFVGDLSVDTLCEWQDLNLGNMYRVRSGETYEFDDITIDAYAGRHTENVKGEYRRDKLNCNGIRGKAHWIGSLEMLNYVITTRSGTKILIWGGMTTPDQKYRFQNIRPDIAIMQISPKHDPDEFAELVSYISPQVVIPHHYDMIVPLFRARPERMDQALTPEKKKEYVVNGEFCTEKYIAAYQNAFARRGIDARMLELKHHVWYRFGLAYAAVE